MFEILFALATVANIGSFVFQLREYKQEKRMMKGDKDGTGGNQSL